MRTRARHRSGRSSVAAGRAGSIGVDGHVRPRQPRARGASTTTATDGRRPRTAPVAAAHEPVPAARTALFGPGRGDPPRLPADPRRDRHGGPRRPGARRAGRRGRPGRPAHPERPPRPGPDRGAHLDRTERVPAACPEPGARRHLRRRPPGLLCRRRAGLRHRHRPGPAAGQLRRLRRLRAAHRRARRHPPGGRRPARTDRSASRDPPPRHVRDVREGARQDLAVPGVRRDAGPRRHGDRRARSWRRSRRARGRAQLHDGHQHELAAPARRADGGRARSRWPSTASRSLRRRSRSPAP